MDISVNDHCNNRRTHDIVDDDLELDDGGDVLNGMRNLQIHHTDSAGMLDGGWNDLAPSYCGGSINDILNSNRHEAGAGDKME